LPLVSHSKVLTPEVNENAKGIEPSAIIADNIPEPTKKNRRK
jgi:hypothetical protein